MQNDGDSRGSGAQGARAGEGGGGLGWRCSIASVDQKTSNERARAAT